MHTFTVWAPNAGKVSLRIGERSYSLVRQERGWWSQDVEEASAGTDYGFVIDDGEPLPDPRSAWQPYGIDGPSRVVDHSAFQWTDGNWQAKPLSSAIIYELHVGTFTPAGTFQGAIECLDYLVDLGVTHVELMPVNEFSGDIGWGYDGVDLYAPHHGYGTPDDLKNLVDACHAKGLAVLLDVVYNHFGPAGNYLGQFGPYFTAAYKTPWGDAVNLDHPGSYEVRRFFRDNAAMWLRDYHFDGLRLDAVHAFIDHSAIHFLEYLSCEVDALASQLGRQFVLIAESDLNDPRVVTSREANGFGIDAQWSDDFHHALHTVLTGEKSGYYEDFGSYAQLAKALRQVFVFDGIYSPHRDRLHGRPPVGLSGHHFLAYAQNHDQVGNRAQGERLSQLVSLGRQKIAAALVLTSPFVPMLFQGEEFGACTPFLYFTRHEDQDLGKNVSEGRRNEFKAFGWEPEQVPDPQAPATFEKSKLSWAEIHREPHTSLLEWHKDLIALRHSHSALTDGRMEDVHIEFDEAAKWFHMKRGDIEVICNLNSERQARPVAKNPQNVLASEEGWKLRDGMLELPPDSAAILAVSSWDEEIRMAKKSKLILVTGATGHQGGAVLRHLRAKNFAVRALTRDPSQPAARALVEQSGVEVVRGDLNDTASLSRALDGVYGVFSVQEWRGGAEAEIRQGVNLAEAAGRAVVSQFVYTSVASADQNTGIPHFDSKFQIEQRVRATGVPFTILRPVFFMENLLGMRSMIEQGALAMPLKPETPLQMIAVDDIGAFVAAAFEHPGKWQGRTVDIAGDEHAVGEIAKLLSNAVGREVRYRQVPWEEFEKQAGKDLTVMFRWFEAVGYHIDIAALRSEHPNLLTFEHWLQTHWEKATRAAQ